MAKSKNKIKNKIQKRVKKKKKKIQLQQNNKIQKNNKNISPAKIKVVGVGGAGGNAVSRMAKSFSRNISFVAINTDIQDLNHVKANKKICIGRDLTKGLGTGMRPDLGRKAAEESKTEISQALKGADLVFITCGLGGGCLRGDSLILTNPDGPVRIDSIKPGSMVYSFDNGRLVKRKVLKAMKTGVKKVLELKTSNRTIYASYDHPFLQVIPLNKLSNGRFSKFTLKWRELKDLEPGDLIVILREVPDKEESIKLLDDFYSNEKFCQLFGFLLGDGWISKSKESWKIYFSPSKNEKNNQKYLNLIKEVFGLQMKKTPSANWYYANSKKTYELLKKLGLNKKATEKEIPSWVFSLPKNQKKAFIIGLADADGSYSLQVGATGLPKKEIKFEMSSEKLIKQLKVLCDSIGLRTSNVSSRTRFIKAPCSKKAENHTSWILKIYRTHQLLGELPHSRARSGLDFLYKFRSRKPLDFFKHFGFNRIKSIKEIGDEEVYDITVEGSHNFIAEGFVVHNTGTGASPVVAEIAKEMGILTIAVVTRPFSFEGAERNHIADEGFLQLKEKVDAMIAIPNDRIFALIDKETSLNKAFEKIDEVLKNAIEGISEIIVTPGIINVDFADIKAVMENTGLAVIGVGKASGKERAINSVNSACNSPLLEIPIDGARKVLLSISSNRDLKMEEVNEIAKVISTSVDPNAKIIFGTYYNSNLKKGEIKTIVIAAGFSDYLTKPVIPQADLFIKPEEIQELKEENEPQEKMQTLDLDLIKAKNKKKTEKKPKAISENEDVWEIPAFLRKKKK